VNTALFINALAQVAPAATKTADPTGMYNLFVVIVVTIIFVAILVSYVRGHKNMDNVAVAPIPASAARPVSTAPTAGADPALIAVLAAAAYTALGQSVRIVSVQAVSTEWAVQGRRDIFLSHKTR
jgi:hypothetical protein